MQNRDYLYLMILGVAPEFQGRGYGGRLLGGVIQESEERQLPIYLETSTESNIRMYEKFGFKVLGRVDHPIINVPQWEMIREPSV